jgi:hypothetical protein
MWTEIWETVQHWPWANIAAFSGVGVAIWTARSTTRQSRQVLRQQAIVDINERSLAWNSAVAGFLAELRDHLAVTAHGPILTNENLDPLLAATTAMDRALKSARMVCNDFQLAVQITETELRLAKFLQLIEGPHPGSAAALRAKIEKAVSDGLTILSEFTTSTEAISRRGLELYALKRGVKFKASHLGASVAGWQKQQESLPATDPSPDVQGLPKSSNRLS